VSLPSFVIVATFMIVFRSGWRGWAGGGWGSYSIFDAGRGAVAAERAVIARRATQRHHRVSSKTSVRTRTRQGVARSW